MQRPFGFRSLLVICSALALLLAALAAVQSWWSTRVAAADAQREREHLDTAAALFASRFHDSILQVVDFMQKDAKSALDSGARLTTPPKIVRDFYYVIDVPSKHTITGKRLMPDGTFAPAEVPSWVQTAHCSAGVLDRPPAVAFPVLQIQALQKKAFATVHILRSFPDRRCFVAQLDETYLKNELLPVLIRESFGQASVQDYNFSIVRRDRPTDSVYGTPISADVKKPFFTLAFRAPAPLSPPPKEATGLGANTFFVERFEYNVVSSARPQNLVFRDGIWELDVAHKGVPLAEAFERTRRRDLLLSLAVELLLGAAIVFLVIGVRRMQRLADQKMQFVAAVSHELRAPVSAISMLSRNQADGLVTAADQIQQYGELMHQQSRRLNEMVEQTLKYAGIHSNLGRPAKTEIDLDRLIHDTVEARRDDLMRRGFEVKVEVAPGLPAIHGDPKLLRMAVDNLLSNAEKYANGGRWIGVSAKYAAAKKEILISVEDRGPGIDSADRASIFEPFFRGHAAVDAQIPGSGIGLSLVRSAVEAHRGTVTLVSQPGSGSTFTLHLPV